VTFQTYIFCVSSWIMGEGQKEKIDWLLMNFPDNLLMSCSFIEQGNLPSSHIEKMFYQHRDSDIPNTHIVCLLFNYGWVTDGKDLLVCLLFFSSCGLGWNLVCVSFWLVSMSEGNNWNCQRGTELHNTFWSTLVRWEGRQVELLANDSHERLICVLK
jgi:hypothetical protein